MNSSLSVDVVIFGGGAAGLWLLDELTRAGYGTLLLEANELGSGQTIASQGIIHGGLKYTLSGLFTSSAQAISQMPLIWRRCLAGEAEPNLAGTRLRSEFCFLWRTKNFRSRLAFLGAQAGLRVAPIVLPLHERPAILAACPGVVARLDEQVIEPASFISHLNNRHASRIIKIDSKHGLEFVCNGPGEVKSVRLINPETGEPLDLRASDIVFTAGAGNAELRQNAGLPDAAMQRRPLQMIMVRSTSGSLPVLNGHCVDGSATRVTITSTRDLSERVVWQIGGQLAEKGVSMNSAELIAFAKNEARSVLPGFETFHNLQWATYRVDRAEPTTRRGARPDEPFAQRQGNAITAWPTKLALVPDMVQRVMALIGQNTSSASANDRLVQSVKHWPRPLVALPPWEAQVQWHHDH